MFMSNWYWWCLLSDIPGPVDWRHVLQRLFLRLPPPQHRQQQPATLWGHQGCYTERYVVLAGLLACLLAQFGLVD